MQFRDQIAVMAHFERFPEQRRHTYRFFPVALGVLP
jgi:hypothetical protein